jgi:hypothetical protein
MRAQLTIVLASLGAAVAVLTSDLEAQRPYAWVMPVEHEEVDPMGQPFSIILSHRAELGLSDSQVERIEDVRERLVEENEPLLAQLRDAEVFRPQGPEEERAVEEARERFTQNARSAEVQVRTILGRAGTERARELIGHDSWAYPPQGEQRNAGEAPQPKTMLIVENHHFQDATIYIVSGPRRQRLGFVGGLKQETFAIPDTFIGTAGRIRLEVRQIPSYTLPLTDEVTVLPGNLVFLRIPPS